MKTNILSLLIILLTSFNAVSQTKTYRLSVSEDSKIKAIKKVSDSGFILHTLNLVGYGIPGKENSLTYLDKDLNERWNIKPILNAPLISSIETPYVYQISRRFSLTKKSIKVSRYGTVQYPFVTLNRINRNGVQDTLTISTGQTSDEETFLAAAIDKENLYYLSYNTSDKRISGNLFFEKLTTALVPSKLYLRKVAHTKRQFSEVAVNIEFDENGDINFLGCNAGLIYIYQKILSEDGKKMKFLVYIIDSNGNLTKKFAINHSTDDYFAPMDYNREFNGAYSSIKNFEDLHSDPPEYFPLLYSLSNLEIDFKSGKIFMYGLTNKNKSCYNAFSGDKISGLYFKIYSLDGTLLHSINKDISSLIEENKALTRHIEHRLRAISFDVLNDNLYRITAGSKSDEFTSFLLSNDKMISSHTNANNYDQYGELAIFDFPKEITYKMNLMATEIEAPVSYTSYISQNAITQSKKIHYLTINCGMSYILIKYEKMKRENLLTFMLFE